MRIYGFLLVLLAARSVRGDALPIFTIQPTNQNVSIGTTANFSVAAIGATSFQWRHNGADIPNETNATLQVANTQTNNAGYYEVIAKNATGWVPSQMAYFSTGDNASGGLVPFSNVGANQATGRYDYNYGPITNGTAQIIAGPELDEMVPVPIFDETIPGGNNTVHVNNGYYSSSYQVVPTVMPGQTVYYRVQVSYSYGSQNIVQPSTVLKLIAGRGSYPIPDTSDIRYPGWLEWPTDPTPIHVPTPTNQTRIPGETVSLTNDFFAGYDYGLSTGQWRKDGVLLPNATNYFQIGFGTFRAVLTITNVQPGDAGVYDVQVLGANWIIGNKTTLNVQLTNVNGTLASPRSDGSNFVADLQGLAGRSYLIQWSSNLFDWNPLQTYLNTTGTLTFTNTASTSGERFYRSVLLP